MILFLELCGALMVGASVMYPFAGTVGYSKGYTDGWNSAYGIKTDEDPAIGIGA